MADNKINFLQNKKVALIHDYLLCFGGAERVLKSFHEMFPEAPIYVICYDKKITDKFFPNVKIISSFAQKIPYFWKKPKYLLPFLPLAVESFDLSAYDLVISSSSAFAKGIITKPKTTHICYCHAPMRFAWDYYYEYGKSRSSFRGLKGIFTKIILHYMRIWDRHCEARVDHFIANSNFTKERIKKFYRRDAEVIYPPCVSAELQNYRCENIRSDQNNYFLIVSQLRYYKRIDIAIEAFNKLEFPLVIIGDGDDRRRLQRMAKPNIEFLGWLKDEDVAEYYSKCKAFIFSGEEDFGITAVEAMSFGKPVIAFRRGGVTESVIEGMTGEFFDDLEPAVLADGVRRILENYKNYNPDIIKQRSMEFDKEKFKDSIIRYLDKISI
ncbi:MAG: hypothetical protein US76_00610 [Parcubacteria group bacterium GW2011_GWA2_38_13b]|nr:MAG: hypothetical protein US76_00610 [Parcubacteria group bacterium GW2011_GWA2_38_13b]